MFRILWSVALIGIVTCGTLYFEPKDSSKVVLCPDKQSRCLQESTCCLLPSGQYGCCPFDKAICCSDRLHCCPEGATCDTPHKRCNQNGVLIPWFEKTRSTSVAPTPSVLVCHDLASTCPINAICCPLPTGFGCCPIRKGVCCSDGQHCCPQGYSCNLARATCTKKDSPAVTWQSIVKTSSLKVQSQGKASQAAAKASKGTPPKVSQSGSSGTKVTSQTVSKTSPQGKRTAAVLGKQVPPVKTQQGSSQQQKTPQKLQQPPQKSKPTPQKTPQTPPKVPPKSQQAAQAKISQQTKTQTKNVKQAPQSKQSVPPVKPATPKQAPQQTKQTPPKQAPQQTKLTPPKQTATPKVQQTRTPQAKTPPAQQTNQQLKQAGKVIQQKVPVQPKAKAVPQQQTPQQVAKQQGQQAKVVKSPPKPIETAAKVAQDKKQHDASKSKATGKDAKSEPGIMAKMVSKVKEFVKKTLIADDLDNDFAKPSKSKPKPVASSKAASKSKTPDKKSQTASNLQGKQAKQTTPQKQAGQVKNIPGKQAVHAQTAGGVKAKNPTQSTTKSTQAVHSKQAPKVTQAQAKQTGQAKSSSHTSPTKSKATSPSPAQKQADAIKQMSLLQSQSVSQTPQGSKQPVGVRCGDKSTCPPGTTCCKMPSGAYGCCPMPSAVCCSDKLHCCPHGKTCNLKKGTCDDTNGIQTPWLEKIPSTSHPVGSRSVICPDKESACPDGTTCCELPSGDWGCCPYKQAVCCSDHLHCCPNGYKCDIQTSQCSQNGISIPWEDKFPSKSQTNDVVCPDQSSSCPDGTTCCKLQSGQYGCCPYPKAQCCSDHLHCCPNGYTCDVTTSQCKQNGITVPWQEKFPSKSVTKTQANDVICPDQTSSCPDGTTCCKLQSGQYGCCPYPKAQCCSDHLHCCPDGYTCDVTTSQCIQNGITIPWQKKFPSKSVTGTQANDVICPDQTSSCPDGTTCCKLQSGQYGCCPYPKAQCCSDHLHCCPDGYTCDVTTSQCRQNGIAIPWQKKFPSKSVTNMQTNIICPDQSSCPDETTCCKLQSGQYGCCPYPKAQCCSDHLHCCPDGYTCDVTTSQCIRNGITIPWQKKFPSKSMTATQANDVICPDQTSSCPDGTTCCKLQSGQYGCCPYPKAQCCSDHLHCCPDGYTCDVTTSQCKQNGMTIPWHKKFPSTSVTSTQVNDVICPDQTSACPDGTTCCKLQSGQYGCCPYPKAQCCSDHLHCCPDGYTCDVTTSQCRRNGITIPWQKKFPSKSVANIQTNVICPDQSSCPDGTTCCQLTSGQYGCCPYPKAQCCSDQLHCCPDGYTCDVAKSQCDKDGIVLPWQEKFPAKQSEDKVNYITCPDQSSTCPDSSTCCKLTSGDYGCCPFKKAVCCSDHVHCCPYATKCDYAKGSCDSAAGVSVPWQKNIAATSINDIMCPDQKSSCPEETTCCMLQSGQYGCCPYPNARCCSDKVHCCPNGYTCDVTKSQCDKNGIIIPWQEKFPSKAIRSSAKTNDVICPDQSSSCPDGSTCCQLISGQYGCCPYPEAECCSDYLHCCPAGYTCDVTKSQCDKDGEVMPWLPKMPSKRVSTVENDITCPDQSSTCPDGTTCCQMQSGHYGCCPMKDAVCCLDHLHCCPQGTTCDLEKGSCDQSDGVSIPWSQKEPAAPTPLSENRNMCPDNSSYCPDKSTCCQLPTEEWGCCPFEKAVCCSDRLHCCPQGYTCDVKEGTCQNGESNMALQSIQKFLASKSEFVVCPDGRSLCPDRTTCCMTLQGQYGCCPLPMASCCKDGIHCCPHGYTCDETHQSCSQYPRLFNLLKNSPSSVAKTQKKWTHILQRTVVQCADNKTECPDGYTCCMSDKGHMECCPHPSAICCKDGVHCCPQGYQCDAGKGQCVKAGSHSLNVIKMLPPSETKFEVIKPAIVPIKKSAVKLGTAVVCPDQRSMCPSDATCCQLPTGGYGCCPVEKATCCADRLHCCPEGFTCDTEKQKCTKQYQSVPWSKKVPASFKAGAVICPDKKSQCDDGNTCCKLKSGAWGCCPLPKAVCCSDGLHCCPEGTKCSRIGICERPEPTRNNVTHTIAWFKKVPASAVGSILCPGNVTKCADGDTCCKLSIGGYGCCPLPKAVCCTDGLHCCPNGYQCNSQQGTCTKGNLEALKTSNLFIRKGTKDSH